MKKPINITAEQMDKILSAIPERADRRGWKTRLLESHRDSILAALETRSYEQIAQALRANGADISASTIANFAKLCRRQDVASNSATNSAKRRERVRKSIKNSDTIDDTATRPLFPDLGDTAAAIGAEANVAS